MNITVEYEYDPMGRVAAKIFEKDTENEKIVAWVLDIYDNVMVLIDNIDADNEAK